MRVLLTGATGYIGSIITHALISSGYTVRGLDAGIFTQNCFYREDAWQSRSMMESLLRKDIRDIIASDLDGCDAVVDFAGLANDPTGELNPVWTNEINHQASARLARLSKQHGVKRHIFASSCSVYGSRGDSLLTESSELSPISEYAKAKVAAEQDILLLHDQQAFYPTILRNATAFGASPRMRFDLVINNLVGFGFTTGQVKVMSDGTAWRPNVHVEDIANAVRTCLEAPPHLIGGQVFNVGMSSENYQVRDLALIVSDVLGNCHVEFQKGATKDPRSYRVSFEKIQKQLKDYRPEWTVKRGVEELKRAFHENDLDYAKFQLADYHNIKTIKRRLSASDFDPTLRLRH